MISAAGAAAAAAVLGLALLARVCLRRVQYLNPTEQLLVKELTRKVVIDGPGVVFPRFFTVLSYKKRPAVTLARAQYCVVTDARTGDRRVAQGPSAFFLGPYETAGEASAGVALGENEGLHVLDRATGDKNSFYIL